MLYLTTRTKVDTYTASWPIRQDRGTDGGLFVPFSLPTFTADELKLYSGESFSSCVAQTLNRLFRLKLSRYDIEFAIGRAPVALTPIGRNLVIAECWHNDQQSYKKLEKGLCELLCRNTERKLTSWVRIAIRLALITGIVAQLTAQGVAGAHAPVDFAVAALDMSDVMAIYYARKMGLPIANIICTCSNNTAAWELLHIGQLNTSAASKASGYMNDNGIPENLERLIYATLGADAVQNYLDAINRGGIFAPAASQLEELRKGIFAAVVSRERLNNLIPSASNTLGYQITLQTGISYGGLMDYRAKYGENRTAILLSDQKE